MTGGTVVVIGPTGRNFAAGMSGGIAYVLDSDGTFENRYNPQMVELEPVRRGSEDEAALKELLENHLRYTASTVAARLLDDWDFARTLFKKVIPPAYERALRERAERARSGAKELVLHG